MTPACRHPNTPIARLITPGSRPATVWSITPTAAPPSQPPPPSQQSKPSTPSREHPGKRPPTCPAGCGPNTNEDGPPKTARQSTDPPTPPAPGAATATDT